MGCKPILERHRRAVAAFGVYGPLCINLLHNLDHPIQCNISRNSCTVFLNRVLRSFNKNDRSDISANIVHMDWCYNIKLH